MEKSKNQPKAETQFLFWHITPSPSLHPGPTSVFWIHVRRTRSSAVRLIHRRGECHGSESLSEQMAGCRRWNVEPSIFGVALSITASRLSSLSSIFLRFVGHKLGSEIWPSGPLPCVNYRSYNPCVDKGSRKLQTEFWSSFNHPHLAVVSN
jgi:hypothetical protein